MRRLQAAAESSNEFYILPTKHLKLQLKVHPQEALQVLKDQSVVVVNGGEQIMIFDLMRGLRNGDSGLLELITHSDIASQCKLTNKYNKHGMSHPSYIQH